MATFKTHDFGYLMCTYTQFVKACTVFCHFDLAAHKFKKKQMTLEMRNFGALKWDGSHFRKQITALQLWFQNTACCL